MRIEQVQRGDVILEGRGSGIEVKKVTEFACSSFGTHINDTFCWDRGSDVRVRQARKDEMVDWDLDNNIPVSDPRSPFNSSERV